MLILYVDVCKVLIHIVFHFDPSQLPIRKVDIIIPTLFMKKLSLQRVMLLLNDDDDDQWTREVHLSLDVYISLLIRHIFWVSLNAT